jgi:hypothetical protein
MNRGSAFDLVCSCRATFSSRGALKIHQNACTKNNERLSKALEKVREASVSRKRKDLAELFPTTGNDDAATRVREHAAEDVNSTVFSILCILLIIFVDICFGWPSNNRCYARRCKGHKAD